MTTRQSRALLHDKNTQKMELLTTPINRLGLKLKGTILEKAAAKVNEDAFKAGITCLQPHYYLGDAYGAVEGTANIALGFYDSRAILQELNEEIRGWRHDFNDMLLVIRHEFGHAFCYSYKLYRSRQFRELFHVKGHFFRTYPDHNRFRPNPWSRDFVNPCNDHYAQRHPDDDFAETFAVWLTPDSQWDKEYRNRPGALRKLKFIGETVQRLGSIQPEVENRPELTYDSVEKLKMPLSEFLGAPMRQYRQASTGFIDPELLTIFRRKPRLKDQRRIHREFLQAAPLIEEQTRTMINTVRMWTGADETIAADFIDKCLARCRSLDLWVAVHERQRVLVRMTGYVTARCGLFHHTGKYFPRKKR